MLPVQNRVCGCLPNGAAWRFGSVRTDCEFGGLSVRNSNGRRYYSSKYSNSRIFFFKFCIVNPRSITRSRLVNAYRRTRGLSIFPHVKKYVQFYHRSVTGQCFISAAVWYWPRYPPKTCNLTSSSVRSTTRAIRSLTDTSYPITIIILHRGQCNKRETVRVLFYDGKYTRDVYFFTCKKMINRTICVTVAANNSNLCYCFFSGRSVDLSPLYIIVPN